MDIIYIYQISIFLITALSSSTFAGEFDTCSYHADVTCAPYSNCTDLPDGGYECVCWENYYGDALRIGTGCRPESGSYPCETNFDCHSLGECESSTKRCRCLSGYEGNGKYECADTNECGRGICDINADCENSPGSFECTCKKYYRGDGFNCTFFCKTQFDCHERGRCTSENCVCDSGFEGDGRFNCSDINECEIPEYNCTENSECINTIGSFECICNPGYEKDGDTCKRIPINCHELYLEGKRWSGFHTIDADGSGPLPPFQVECLMRPPIGMGLTVVNPLSPDLTFTRTNPNETVVYETDKPNIAAVVDNSGYCYQDMSSTCKYGSPIMLDGDDMWFDRYGVPHETWGGSTVTGMCMCGELGLCNNCYCDGTIRDVVDNGRLIDRAVMPIDGFKIGLINWKRMLVTVGPVVCGPKPFHIPLDCHDAKFNYNKKKNGPMIIDVDGPDGPLEPVWVLCDMETYPHVGVTIVPHDRREPNIAIYPEEFPVTYTAPPEVIDQLIDNSTFCRQEVSYTCTDSSISTGGAYFTDSRGQQKSYWPGSLLPSGCACWMTQSCDNNQKCNCDNYDGVPRRDFGPVTNKEDLPIGSITLNDLGEANQRGELSIGPLKCSQFDFGFEATCESYRLKGHDYSYTYQIDPDGPNVSFDETNTPAFPVECEMKHNPPEGITIVHHGDDDDNLAADGALNFDYLLVSDEQLIALTSRAVYCVQKIDYNCTSAPLFDASGPLVSWVDVTGNQNYYLAGTGGEGCECGLTQSCDGGPDNLCNCDVGDATQRRDTGALQNKDGLPAKQFNFPAGQNAFVNVGPMMCSDTFPTCYDLWIFMKQQRLPSEKVPINGEITIDPDGHAGVEPFRVSCRFPITVVPVIPGDTTVDNPDPNDGPVKECFNISYSSGLSPEQLQALKDNSRYCTQYLEYECVNSPITDKVTYETCDGTEQPGWGGSNGEDKCACGVTGTCDGGPESNCNCDMDDGQTRTDKGYIHEKSRLPACKVCIELDQPKDGNSPRRGTYTVSDLQCSGRPIGLNRNCQQRRNNKELESGTYILDPDGTGPTPPFPVYCSYEGSPATGTAEIRPKNETKDVPATGLVNILYFIFDFQIANVKKLIRKSSYCEQEIYVLCGNAQVPTSLQGRKKDDWMWRYGGGIRCKSGACKCKGNEFYGGFVKFQNQLPVTKVKLPWVGPKANPRTLFIGPLKCFNIYKDCHEIKRRWYAKNPNRDNIYAIDPDGAAGVPYFPVTCDFKFNKTYGITIVPIKPEHVDINITISGYPYPEQKTRPVYYRDATPEQINKLGLISDFCHQGIQYKCRETPVNYPTYGSYNTYDGSVSPSFGTGPYTDTDGCACTVTKTCPEGNKCHCDAQGPMVAYDYGYVNKDAVPVTKVEFSNSDSPNAYGTVRVTDVRCAPQPFDLPKDCEDARLRGFKSGEIMIWPSDNVDPFIVYCDINGILKGHGVTVIGNDREDPFDVDPNTDNVVNVTYNGATDEQVEALTDYLPFCYQPIKYNCYNSLLNGKFEWYSASGTFRYLGTGTNEDQTCSCGNEGLCGGNVTKSVLDDRKCNCDAGDEQWRRDAGIIASSDDLPILGFRIAQSDLAGSASSLTLGKLYCGPKPFDLDECEMDFHDCHPTLAKCKNKFGTFECRCNSGYRGLQVDGVWANGRNCYDDDECKKRVCPVSADCINEPGTFSCECKDGYNQTGPRDCININECLDEDLNDCDPNADCYDVQGLEGKYKCRCRRGFRGNGSFCEPVGACTCFGDPHCISYDDRWLHFMGDCQYVMSTDGCNGSPPTFEVRTVFWNQNKPYITDVSWVKEVEIRTFGVPNHRVKLLQNNELMIDSILKKPPYQDSRMYVRRFDHWMRATLLDLGITISWDGRQSVEVVIPPAYKNGTCGLCGNFDDDDSNDWIVGEECPATGSVTENQNLFGNSWVVKSYVDNNQCGYDCNAPPTSECNEMDRLIGEQYCNDYIYGGQRQAKIFQECLGNMTEAVEEQFFSSCVMDLCKNMKDKMAALCDHAAQLVLKCFYDYGVEITNWKSEEMCSPQCGDFQEFREGREADQMDCSEVILGTARDDKSTIPEEACFCKDGYYMDAGQCVKPEECGCMYEGTYYSMGDSVVKNDCGEVWVCADNNTFDKSSITCHENATCGNEGGVYGCHCLEGFISMDNSGTDCTDDPCKGNPCSGEGQICVVNITSETGYVCECIMGYQGDCNKCDDIDECATHTDNCPGNSECINTAGSFECKCYDGFTDKERAGENLCVDINECETRLDNCDNTTSLCLNTLGGYECAPCQGESEGEECCVCRGPVCDTTTPVCGTDGETYDNEKDLVLADCRLRIISEREGTTKRIEKDYEGVCQDSCATVQCKKYQQCVDNEGTDKPSCECEPCTESESEPKEVCTVMLDKFESPCEFKKEMCKLDMEEELLPDTSQCDDETNGPPVSEWGDWSECSVTCGNGTQTRSRNATANIDTDFLEEKYPLDAVTACYNDPCPDSPCASFPCATDGAVCILDEDNNPTCQCPDCEGQGLEEVCGKVGDKRKTFKNPCEVQADGCMKEVPFEVLHEGECGVEPLDCQKMQNFVRKSNQGCPKMVNVGMCEGGCGIYSNHCCQPTVVIRRNETFYCNGQTTVREFDVVEACECQETPLT